jgi:AAA domain
MSYDVPFPKRQSLPPIVTEFMKATLERTLAIHQGGQFAMWSGPSRVGKTTAAEWAVSSINAQADSNPDGFRACVYEVGQIGKWSGREDKRMLRSVYQATLGQLDDGTYRRFDAEALASDLVHGLKRENIQLIMIDEAGGLSLDAIGGLMLLIDVAASSRHDWRLTIVLIGMDDLPIKVRQRAQILNRFHEVVCFAPFELDDTWRLLASLHPHFAALTQGKPEDDQVVQLIHEATGGKPGLMVPLVRRIDLMARVANHPIDLTLVNATLLLAKTEREQLERQAKHGYVTPTKDPSASTDQKGGKAKKRKRRETPETKPGPTGAAPLDREDAEDDQDGECGEADEAGEAA